MLVTAVLVWRLIAAWRRDRTLEKKSVDVARAGHDVRQRLTPNHLTDSRTAAVEVRNRCAAKWTDGSSVRLAINNVCVPLTIVIGFDVRGTCDCQLPQRRET